MKKIIILIFILAGLAGSFVFYNNLPIAAREVENVKSGSVSSIPTPELKIENPISIQIPSLSVEAYVEHVGKDSEGRMDIPSDFNNAAWYSLGATPGESGNSVIAAHFNKPDGSPSVFYNLEDLKKDDEIIVADTTGNVLVFKVIDTDVFESSSFPIKSVFGKNTKKMLNLITCAGDYDAGLNEYSQRTVVFSALYSINGKVI